jgi:NADH-quinone oxidoreductase subunit J
MVLFLFVVMMLDINFEKLREGFWRNLPLAGTVAAIMVAEMTLILVSPDVGLSNFKEPAALAADYSNVKDLGRQIYTTYLYPFELAAVLLLLAIVAAIALTMRKRKDNKWVDPAEQVKVRRNDRIRMVKMAAEPRVVRGGETDNDNNAAA